LGFVYVVTMFTTTYVAAMERATVWIWSQEHEGHAAAKL